jgi:hypothetical protein
MQRHGKVDAKGAGFIGSTHDDAPAGPSGHRDRPATKANIISLMNRRVEGVQVYVEDGPWPELDATHASASLP